jgi:DNA-binding MarR family transcriptional regulator
MDEHELNALQGEIRQTVPFRSPGQEAVVAIERTADLVLRRYDRALAPFDVTVAQYNVLRILRGAKGQPLPTLEVAERMIQQTPGVTRMIDRLEGKGLVARQACPHDRRIVYCVITEAGMDLLARTDDLINRIDDEFGEAVAPDQLTALVDALARIRQAAQR